MVKAFSIRIKINEKETITPCADRETLYQTLCEDLRKENITDTDIKDIIKEFNNKVTDEALQNISKPIKFNVLNNKVYVEIIDISKDYK